MGERWPADAEKAAMRLWVERWKVVGAILEEEKWERLRASSDDELTRQALDLLGLWQSDVPGDDGEGLLIQQRTFAKLPNGSGR